MLDIKKAYQLDDLELTFIEPFPERLESLLEKDDYEQVTIFNEKVQFVDFEFFLILWKEIFYLLIAIMLVKLEVM
ncbi:hypothetical protein SAMN05421832_10238 [Psychrobacillus psychrodurans]|nr:hypothetical protein SAMN05421832_10238 [Psychrobacillus psychrodurans]